ncbi:MAG: D-alanine--D-alanine ligase [Synergistaceae bacterium]
MKIVVACGGTSPEREVSLNSGKAVYDGLLKAGFEAVLVDVTSIKDFINDWKAYNADGVFVALHGDWGENGEFQSALQSFGIKYTGSKPEACMLAMDKFVSKLLFKEYGIQVPDGFTLNRSNYSYDKMEKFLDKHNKIIVKPNSGGSTVGVTVVESKNDILKALESAWDIEDTAIIEEFIDGEEVTVPVFEENGIVFSMPPIKICPKLGFYDYSNKYTAGATEYLCPAPLSEEILKELSQMAINAHKALGCKVYSRVDFRISKTQSLYILEVNTAPGMTATSLVPKSARALGYTFDEFLERVISASFD